MQVRRPWWVIVAVVAFAVSVFAAARADRERCRGAVVAARLTPGETIGEALARVAPGGDWSVEKRPAGTRAVSYATGDARFEWVCSPHAVPLVEPENAAAHELTPWSASL